jgi:hypothetical protein
MKTGPVSHENIIPGAAVQIISGTVTDQYMMSGIDELKSLPFEPEPLNIIEFDADRRLFLAE